MGLPAATQPACQRPRQALEPPTLVLRLGLGPRGQAGQWEGARLCWAGALLMQPPDGSCAGRLCLFLLFSAYYFGCLTESPKLTISQIQLEK